MGGELMTALLQRGFVGLRIKVKQEEECKLRWSGGWRNMGDSLGLRSTGSTGRKM